MSVEAYYRLRKVAAAQDGVITAEQCRAQGVSPQEVKTWCRDKRWRRLNRGVYLVDADLHDDPPRRSLIRAAVLSAGPKAVAVLSTAAELHGLAGLRTDSTIHLSLPGSNARPRRACEPDLRLHQFTLRPDEIVLIDGIPATTPARTAADVMLTIDRYSAVCVLDSGLNRGLLVPDDLLLIDQLLTGRRGAVKARSWLAEADPRAESPLETRIRLRCVDGGIPPDTLQLAVFDAAGHLIAICDLAWRGPQIIAEGDGVEAHDNPSAVFRDRTRQNALVNAGYHPLRFTWPDTMSARHIPAVVREAAVRITTRAHNRHDPWSRP